MSVGAPVAPTVRSVAAAVGVVIVAAVAVIGVSVGSDPPGPIALDGPGANVELLDLSGEGQLVEVELTVDDDGFHPAFVKVPEGSEVAITVHNRGTVERTFTIENDVASFDEHVDPGESASTPFPLEMPDDRAVRFFDHEHYWAGPFQGALYTRTGQPLAEGDDLPEPPDD